MTSRPGSRIYSLARPGTVLTVLLPVTEDKH
jgi:hypothetical protein